MQIKFPLKRLIEQKFIHFSIIKCSFLATDAEWKCSHFFNLLFLSLDVVLQIRGDRQADREAAAPISSFQPSLWPRLSLGETIIRSKLTALSPLSESQLDSARQERGRRKVQLGEEEERGSVMPFHLLVCERADTLLAERYKKKVESGTF